MPVPVEVIFEHSNLRSLNPIAACSERKQRKKVYQVKSICQSPATASHSQPCLSFAFK